MGGLVSVGASIGLDAVGAPSMLQSFIPSVLGSLVSGAGNSGGGGGPPGPDALQNQGENVFKKITSSIVKFGKGVVSAVGNVVSFGAKVIEGGVSFVKQGFAKAADFFSGIFNRDTQEALIRAGNGSIENGVLNNTTVDGTILRTSVENLSMTYDTSLNEWQIQEGTDFKILGGLARDDQGGFFGDVAYAQEVGDNVYAHQDFQDGKLMGVRLTRGSNPNDELLLSMHPYGNETSLKFDPFGQILNGTVTAGDGSFDSSYLNGRLVDYRQTLYQGVMDPILGTERFDYRLTYDAVRNQYDLGFDGFGDSVYSHLLNLDLSSFDGRLLTTEQRAVLEAMRAGGDGAAFTTERVQRGMEAFALMTALEGSFALPDVAMEAFNQIYDREVESKVWDNWGTQDVFDFFDLDRSQIFVDRYKTSKFQDWVDELVPEAQVFFEKQAVQDYLTQCKTCYVIISDSTKIQQLKDFWSLERQSSDARQKFMLTGAHNAVLDTQGNSLAQFRIGAQGVHFSDVLVQYGIAIVHIDGESNAEFEGFKTHAQEYVTDCVLQEFQVSECAEATRVKGVIQ